MVVDMRPAAHMILWLLLLALLSASLSACSMFAPEPPPSPPAPPSQAQACLDELARRGAAFRLELLGETREECRVENGIVATRLPLALNRPAHMACETALALARFEEGALQPLARQHLSRSVVKIHHAGAYDCRAQRNGKRQSQHAFGRAIDILAFELDDGSLIKVKEQWRGRTPRTAFLRSAAQQACQHFNLVLTPDSDADHQDHLHVDLGPWKRCW